MENWATMNKRQADKLYEEGALHYQKVLETNINSKPVERFNKSFEEARKELKKAKEIYGRLIEGHSEDTDSRGPQIIELHKKRRDTNTLLGGLDAIGGNSLKAIEMYKQSINDFTHSKPSDTAEQGLQFEHLVNLGLIKLTLAAASLQDKKIDRAVHYNNIEEAISHYEEAISVIDTGEGLSEEYSNFISSVEQIKLQLEDLYSSKFELKAHIYHYISTIRYMQAQIINKQEKRDIKKILRYFTESIHVSVEAQKLSESKYLSEDLSLNLPIQTRDLALFILQEKDVSKAIYYFKLSYQGLTKALHNADPKVVFDIYLDRIFISRKLAELTRNPQYYKQALRDSALAIEKHKSGSKKHADMLGPTKVEDMQYFNKYVGPLLAVYKQRKSIYFSMGQELKGFKETEFLVSYITTFINAYERVLDIKPKQALTPELREGYLNLYIKRAHLNFDIEQYLSALRDIDLVIRHNPKEGKYYYVKGQIHTEQANSFLNKFKDEQSLQGSIDLAKDLLDSAFRQYKEAELAYKQFLLFSGEEEVASKPTLYMLIVDSIANQSYILDPEILGRVHNLEKRMNEITSYLDKIDKHGDHQNERHVLERKISIYGEGTRAFRLLGKAEQANKYSLQTLQYIKKYIERYGESDLVNLFAGVALSSLSKVLVFPEGLDGPLNESKIEVGMQYSNKAIQNLEKTLLSESASSDILIIARVEYGNIHEADYAMYTQFGEISILERLIASVQRLLVSGAKIFVSFYLEELNETLKFYNKERSHYRNKEIPNPIVALEISYKKFPKSTRKPPQGLRLLPELKTINKCSPNFDPSDKK